MGTLQYAGIAYEKRMHNVLPTYEQRLPGALGTYAAYVKRVKNVPEAYAQLTCSALVSVWDFIYKNGRNRYCVHD